MAKTFDMATFRKECTWYTGKTTKKLLDGYEIHAGDPYAEENERIEAFLNETWADMKKWRPIIDALAPEKQIRFIQAMFVHLAMMGTGARCTEAEVKALKGESSMNYDLKLSHFIRDYSKEWLKGNVPFTQEDLLEYLRLLTYLNYNAGDRVPYSTDIMYRYNLFPFKQFFKHLVKFAKKNPKSPVFVRALRDFRGSLGWHAKRTSQEQALANDLIAKTEDLLKAW